MANVTPRLLIVGGGIGGMSLTIASRRAGLEVDLVDIDPAWRAAGAGLSLNAASLGALGLIGVLEAVTAEGHVHAGRRTLDADGGIIADVPAYRPTSGDPHATGGILRPVLHAILVRAVRASGVTVRLGLTVEALDQDLDGVEAVFSDGSRARYDAVAGADGILSRVRQLVMPETGSPRFTGQGCWRAIFDRPAEVESNWLFVDTHRKVGLNPISDSQMYMFMLESAPDNPWHEQADWAATLSGKMASFGGLVRRLANEVSLENTNYRPLETLLAPPPWHRGRVVLLGDAVHATTPHAAYGAGLAIGDAIVLAEKLASPAPIDDALTRYAARRYERCRAVLEGAVGLGALEIAGAPIEEQLAASARLFAVTQEPF